MKKEDSYKECSTSYRKLFDNMFPSIEESQRLLKLSSTGDIEARWKLVLSEAKLVKYVILKYFPDNFNDYTISDAFMSLYKTASYKGNSNVHFMQFRHLAMLQMYTYVSRRIKSRSRSAKLRYFGFGGYKNFREVRIEAIPKGSCLQMTDENESVVSRVTDNDAREFCIKKMNSIKNKETKERIKKLLSAISDEENKFDLKKVNTTKQNLFNIKQRVKRDILRECPEILEAL